MEQHKVSDNRQRAHDNVYSRSKEELCHSMDTKEATPNSEQDNQNASTGGNKSGPLKRSLSIKKVFNKTKKATKGTGTGASSANSKKIKNLKALEISLPIATDIKDIDQPLSGVICTPIRSPFIQNLLPSPVPMQAVTLGGVEYENLPWPDTPPIERNLSALAQVVDSPTSESRFRTAAQHLKMKLMSDLRQRRNNLSKSPSIDSSVASPLRVGAIKSTSTSTTRLVDGEGFTMISPELEDTKENQESEKKLYPASVSRHGSNHQRITDAATKLETIPKCKTPTFPDSEEVKRIHERFRKSFFRETPPSRQRGKLPGQWQGSTELEHDPKLSRSLIQKVSEEENVAKGHSYSVVPLGSHSNSSYETVPESKISSSDNSDTSERTGFDYKSYLRNRIQAAHKILIAMPEDQQDVLSIGSLEELVDKWLIDNPDAWTYSDSTRDRHDWLVQTMLRGNLDDHQKLLHRSKSLPSLDHEHSGYSSISSGSSGNYSAGTFGSSSGSSIASSIASSVASSVDSSIGFQKYLQKVRPVSRIVALLENHPCALLMEEPGLQTVLSDETGRAKFLEFCGLAKGVPEKDNHGNSNDNTNERRISCRRKSTITNFNEVQVTDPRTTIRQWVLANTQLAAQAIARELETTLTNDSPTSEINHQILQIKNDALEKLNSDAFPKYLQQLVSNVELNEEFEAAILENHDHTLNETSKRWSFDLENIKRVFEIRQDQASAILPWSHSFCITNSRQQIRYVSDGFQSLTEYTTYDLLGKYPRMLQGEGNHAPIDRIVRLGTAVERNEPITELLVNYKKSNTPFYNLMFLYPILDKSGLSARYWMGAYFDITKFLMAACKRELLFKAPTVSKDGHSPNNSLTYVDKLRQKSRKHSVEERTREDDESHHDKRSNSSHNSGDLENEDMFPTVAEAIRYLRDRFSKFFLMHRTDNKGSPKHTITYLSDSLSSEQHASINTNLDFLSRLESFPRNSPARVNRIRGFLAQEKPFISKVAFIDTEKDMNGSEDTLLYCVPLNGETGSCTNYLCFLWRKEDSIVFSALRQ